MLENLHILYRHAPVRPRGVCKSISAIPSLALESKLFTFDFEDFQVIEAVGYAAACAMFFWCRILLEENSVYSLMKQGREHLLWIIEQSRVYCDFMSVTAT